MHTSAEHGDHGVERTVAPESVSTKHPSQRLISASCGIVIAIVLAAVFVPHFHRDTGLMSLIRFGENHRQRLAPELAGLPVYLVPHHDGFDGQYYAHMAVHPPWIYHDAIDHYDFPAYRIRRVFLPALAWMLGFGKPLWIVHIYSFFNILSWLGMAWLLTAWLPLQNWVNFGRWTGCLVAAGVLESLRGSLTDLPSLLMMFGGMRLWEMQRSRLGDHCFSQRASSPATRRRCQLWVYSGPARHEYRVSCG